MWAAIPPYVAQPLVELTPETASAGMYDPNVLSARYAAPTGTQAFTFPDDPRVGAIHLLTAVRFPATSGTEDRLRISFGSRYSLVIRAVRHSLQSQGAIGDALIVGANAAWYRPGFPAHFNYLVAALQDNGSDVESKILHLADLHLFGPFSWGQTFAPGILHVCAGFCFNAENDLVFFGHIASRPGFGAGTYSMRAFAEHDDAMVGPRTIAFTDQSESGFYPEFACAAANYGPFMDTQIFRPDTEQFRRARANTCVGSLRSRALNWAYVLNPNSDSGMANIDCCGHAEFDYGNYVYPWQARRYVAALGSHPDGMSGYVKPAVSWNSNAFASGVENEQWSSVVVTVPPGISLPITGLNTRGDTGTELTINASSDGNGNNEYTGEKAIDVVVEGAGFSRRYVRLRCFVALTAYEEYGNRLADNFEDVTLSVRYEASVRVFFVDENGAIVVVGGDAVVTGLPEGPIDIVDTFQQKNVTIAANGG